MPITLPPKFSSVIKKFGSGSIFCVFCIRGKHFERCFDSSEPPYKRTPKSRMAIVKFIHFISPLTSWSKLESPGIIPLLLNKERNYPSSLDGVKISFILLFFKKRGGQQNHPQCLKTPFSRLLFCDFFRTGLINTHRTQCARFLCVTNF